MPAAPDATADHIRDVNTRYHDAAAETYDAKWGIDFGDTGQRQVAAKLAKALGERPAAPFGDALEIGSGTGYFTLNLLRLGLVERATATDISPGMLATLGAHARRLGLEVETVVTGAERLPFADASFDLVFGHAVLHHIPDPAAAFAEFRRVLRPGGVIAFCGEPSRYGDLLASLPKRAGVAAAPLWRAAVGAPERTGEVAAAESGHGLEWEVDVHSFAPADLRRLLREAGFEKRRVGGEELLANMYGWVLRTMESSAEHDRIPMRWRNFAFRSYLALQHIDSGLLEPRLPAELFYNLVLSGRKPVTRAARDARERA
jgi:ubiquinone/menaquinone biosynthesis C-methylase UbiE